MKSPPLIALFLVMAATLACAESSNWPGFRGDGSSHSEAENLPLNWSEEEGEAWRLALAGYGQSSPVVWGDLVVVTSADGPMKDTLIVTAASLKDGSVLWEKRFSGTQKVESSDMVSRGAPTPAINETGIYALFESGDLIALDHAGEELWKRSLVTEYGEFLGGHGLGSSLAQTENSLVVLADHDGPSWLLRVDKNTGENLWKKDREPRTSWNSPTVVEDTIYISSNGRVEAIDLASGEQQWKLDGIEGNTVASASVSEDLVIVGSSNPQSSLAVKTGNPAEIVWRARGATSSFGSPLIHQDRVYFVNRAGAVSCNALASGEQLWETRLPGSTWASPLAAGDRLYFFTKEGACTVLKAGTDLPMVLAENPTLLEAEQRLYGFAAVNGAFVIRSGSELICVR